MVHRFSHEFNLPGGPIKTQIVAGLTPRVRSMVWVQPELCIHKEFPSDADPAGLRTKLSEPIVRRGHKKGIFSRPGQSEANFAQDPPPRAALCTNFGKVQVDTDFFFSHLWTSGIWNSLNVWPPFTSGLCMAHLFIHSFLTM